MIRIDGAYGEGGGQILRTAISMAAISGEAVEIYNIRAGRPVPGLRRQHITAIEAAARICNANVDGLKLGSRSIIFEPGTTRPSTYHFNIGTAGSISLVIQACLPIIVAHNVAVRLVLKGGTDVKWSPPIDYIRYVFLPLIGKLGVNAAVRIKRRGYYPRGGGEVVLDVFKTQGSGLFGADLTKRGGLCKVCGTINISGLSHDVEKRLKHAVIKRFTMLKYDVKLNVDRSEALDKGVGVVLWAEFENTILGASALGEKGVRAEVVGENAAMMLESEIKGCGTLDVHMCDQIMPYMAICREDVKFLCAKMSRHATTNMWVINKFPLRKITAVKHNNCWHVRNK